jgi:hypothetical protein
MPTKIRRKNSERTAVIYILAVLAGIAAVIDALRYKQW